MDMDNFWEDYTPSHKETTAEITRLRDENVELKSQIVMECNEDEVPTFNQGLFEHELLEVVTAKRLDTLVALVVSLRARLAEAEAAKADAWDEGYNSGRLDEMTDKRMRSNPYRSKTDG